MDTSELIQLATLISVISNWRRTKTTFARMLRSPLFRREWKTLGPVFAPDRAFCRYVERVEGRSEGPTSRVEGVSA